jgi:AcrR family transcriptional regulator
VSKTRATHSDADLWHGSLSAHRAQQAEHIAHAAIEVISREGIAGLTMSAVAEEAGISRQTLYKYYPDVDALLLGLASMSEDADAHLAERVAAEPNPIAGLRVFVTTIHAAAAAGHPGPIELAAALPADTRSELDEHARRGERVVIGLLERGQATGAFDPGLDPVMTGRVVYRTVMATYDMATEADASGFSDRLIEIIMRMLGATEAPAG